MSKPYLKELEYLLPDFYNWGALCKECLHKTDLEIMGLVDCRGGSLLNRQVIMECEIMGCHNKGIHSVFLPEITTIEYLEILDEIALFKRTKDKPTDRKLSVHVRRLCPPDFLEANGFNTDGG